MQDFSIRDKCKVNTNEDADTFVGILCEDNAFSIHFPLGFHVSADEKELRKEILLLMSTIASTVGRKDSEIQKKSTDYNQTSFPFQAYLFIIYDYYDRGYYKEIEVRYNAAKKGKIDWNRTIKRQKPFIQNNDIFYLDFITKRNSMNENELISLIHEYCVYDAFAKIGWLFTGSLPKKPGIKFNRKLFKAVLTDKLMHTFNDKNKLLFQSMLAVIDNLGEKSSHKEFKYGTYRFEYVWEALIDRIFGISGKEAYYPKTKWDFGNSVYDVNETYENSPLRPDAIMVFNQDVFVLDAKYYKYGVIKTPDGLPKSTDINKQITYGEYIAKEDEFKKRHGADFKVYNAFIMPFDSLHSREQETILRIGEATGNWKHNLAGYEKVQGILIDIKHLMKIGMHRDSNEITKLAECILQYAEGYR